MRIGLYCLLAVLWPVLNCFCQVTLAVIRPLEIGDHVPPHLELTNVHNYSSNKIRVSDLEGKLVILDLWSTWCSACIAAFPKAYELQNELVRLIVWEVSPVFICIMRLPGRCCSWTPTAWIKGQV